jgi:uncharacterized RDD family membrane protein YckC
MDWYYAKEGHQVGPISEDDLQQLAAQGTVAPGTLVWHEGMEDWRPYGAVGSQEGRGVAAGPQSQCILCNRLVPEDQVLRFPEGVVCGECKPTYLQCVREGVPLQATVTCAGFWIRFLAIFLDIVITGVIGMVVGTVFFAALAAIVGLLADDPTVLAFLVVSMYMLMLLVRLLVGVSYETWFVGRFGATPGKMTLGLKVVRADGGNVTYLRAFARYWGKILSFFTLLIGFIMAAFDSEKRGLHDHICDTRVVRAR